MKEECLASPDLEKEILLVPGDQASGRRLKPELSCSQGGETALSIFIASGLWHSCSSLYRWSYVGSITLTGKIPLERHILIYTTILLRFIYLFS